MYVWWRDIVREGTYEGQHTKQVQLGLRNGMLLFIFSELLFFISFFNFPFCYLFSFCFTSCFVFGALFRFFFFFQILFSFNCY